MRVPKTHWLVGKRTACRRDQDACVLTDGSARTVVALARDWPGTVCGKCLSAACEQDPDAARRFLGRETAREKIPAPRQELPGPQSKET